MKTNPVLEDLRQNLVGQLETLSSSNSAEMLPEIASALRRASELQFPNSRQEEWKYSPFTIANEVQFILHQGQRRTAVSLALDGFEDCTRLVFVDGAFEPSLSDKIEIEGLTLRLLAETEQPFAQSLPGYEENIFSHLNTASALCGGIQIVVSPKTVIEQPLVFIHLFSETDQAAWVQPRIQIQVGDRAEVSFAEMWEIPAGRTLVVNSITEIHIASEANVNWVNFENGASGTSMINQTRAEVAEKAVFQHFVISLGDGYLRNNLEIKINGREGDAHMYGLSLGNQKLHVDHHTFVNHKAVNTTSNQLYKCILAGKAIGVFNGKILVDQVAQKTNAYQSSKNILLSTEAKVNAKPQLEIFADDVKCSHGATIGQLDEEPIFYLRSRGLDETTAKHLLLQAFASEIFDKVKHPALKHRIGEKVTQYMSAMLQPQ